VSLESLGLHHPECVDAIRRELKPPSHSPPDERPAHSHRVGFAVPTATTCAACSACSAG
jgi:hypothetical protein